MQKQEMPNMPGLIPVTSEVSILAATLNEEIYSNPRIYKAAVESGRLVTDTVVVHYVPREGEDEALKRINDFITSEHSRHIEFDSQSDDLLYEDTEHLAAVRRSKEAKNTSDQQKLVQKVHASRLKFMINRIVDFQESQQTAPKRFVRKAG